MASEHNRDRFLCLYLCFQNLINCLDKCRHALALKTPFSNTPRSTFPFNFLMTI
jgi:hypothetical protein